MSDIHLLHTSIEDEMRSSYLDYAMSVIVSRALPDVRDGLKPVHRRILYAMHEAGYHANKPFRKSARICGDVMGKYHPHGEDPIYGSLVRMAQDFSLRIPLIEGQGNFGSIDGDEAAAMRYTESRMSKLAHHLLNDIDKETVEFQNTYDNNGKEPQVIPAEFPNLLLNGTGGIAVGMATNIPPHNLGELIDGCIALVNNPHLQPEDMLDYIKGPDFPTGGTILGRTGIHSAVTTGRGSVIMRGKAHVEPMDNGKNRIIVTEIPFQVNKANLVERIAELARDKKIEGITDLRDESNKQGIRIVVELRRDVIPDVLLNQLYSFTALQTSFGVNMLALNHGKPRLMNVKEILQAFNAYREEVITRRTTYLLGKSRDRAHILLGLSLAVANIDEVIALIRQAKDPVVAKEQLLARAWPAEAVIPLIKLVDEDAVPKGNECYLTEIQAKAILEMRLQRLTGLEQQKITDELSQIIEDIQYYLNILNSRERLLEVLQEELTAIKEQYATPRMTDIEMNEYEQDIEDLIQKEDMIVTVTMGGYIKRVPLSTYRAQKRGGKGRSAAKMKEEDAIEELFVANTHTPLLFFSTKGKAYKIKVYKLPLGGPQSKGRALVNIFPLEEGETINNIMALPEDESTWEGSNIFFATANGNIRRNDLSDFTQIRANGKIAIGLAEDDTLIGVKVCQPDDHMLLASKFGKALRFPVEAVRVFKGRSSSGVRGIRLAEGDAVISLSTIKGSRFATEQREAYLRIPLEERMNLKGADDAALEKAGKPHDLDVETLRNLVEPEQFILTVTSNGYGKRTSSYEYRVTNRGGQGIINMITTERNGHVVASFPAHDDDQIILMTDKGTIIRTSVEDIRVIGRNTQGVKVLNTDKDEHVVSVASLMDTGDESQDDSAEEVSEEGESDDSSEA